MTRYTDKENDIKHYEINDAEYWRKMYDELELQMYQMMEMTLELIDKESRKYSDIKYNSERFIPKSTNDIEKELRRLQLFEHRIKVTLLGKITLKYIALKRRLRKIIKGK